MESLLVMIKNMTNIMSSASKIVFIVLTIAVCVGLFAGIIEAKDFMVLASMAFTFYFSNKGNTNEPFAGK